MKNKDIWFEGHKCPSDYRRRHRWESKGVVLENKDYIEIFKCFQCKRIIKHKLIPLNTKGAMVPQ